MNSAAVGAAAKIAPSTPPTAPLVAAAPAMTATVATGVAMETAAKVAITATPAAIFNAFCHHFVSPNGSTLETGLPLA